jgi:4'-phosphopantetheinyl transferase
MQFSPGAVIPGRQDVHVWLIRLDRKSKSFWSLLSDDERERAMSFAFETDLIRFVSGRANMRKILARYLGTSAQAIRFKYGPYGKPSLVNEADPIFFNFSHSDGVGLLAVGTGFELGIDVEQIRKDIETVEIARSFFSEAERRDLATVASELRHQTFFNCWTRKEAILKGIGMGLNLRLDGFDVSSVPGATAQLAASRLPLIDMTQWSLCSIDVGIDFAAALAVATRGVSINVKIFELQLVP